MPNFQVVILRRNLSYFFILRNFYFSNVTAKYKNSCSLLKLLSFLVLELTMTNNSLIEWYAGRAVFVTGGTGFMGKVLVEKLLRSIPDLKRIYILCRAKKGFTPAQRVEELTKLPVGCVLNIIFFLCLHNNNKCFCIYSQTFSYGLMRRL